MKTPRRRPSRMLAWLGQVIAAQALLGVGPATEAREVLTLDRALEIAESGSWRLRAVAARADGARAEVDSRRAERRLRVDASVGYLRTDDPVAVFGNLLLQERFGAENFDLDRLNRPSPLDDTNARIAATMTLWSGGRQRHALTIAEHDREATVADHQRARQAVAAQVVARYGDAVVAIRGLEAARAAQRTAEAHVTLARDRVETGLAVDSDLLAAEVRASETRDALVRAESAVDLARAALNQVLGRDLSTPFDLPEAPIHRHAMPADTGSERTARALAQRPDLTAARERLAARRSELRLSRAARMPRLEAHAHVAAHAERPTDDVGTHGTLGLRFSVPLFDGGRAHARRRAVEARLREAEAELARFEDAIALEVRAAFLARRSAEERLRLAAAAIALGERSLIIVEDRYREGLITLAELLDAQVALAEALARGTAAERDLVIAGAQLDLASGDLPAGDLPAREPQTEP